ncbi:DUF5691 domain-containing protein [Nocardia goodfellowii]|uniref:Uncharacterized protein n=1 Tax=Nocardia goodfellowii TaxID=882446 RepID=A0ABS4QFC3_9NOCA|nr:DUF5691 domain-containing protein [Nocardia goodfellowii]MBP2189386.1 hypothetical protein [Nocardia goodfellowii]
MNDTGAQVSTPAARQRAVRVSAGLEELDIWLGDQVRTGLAQADRSYRGFAAMAARMVDAQAPGVAAVLRRLPEIIAGRADWPELLLREYARLHLLVAAHRRLDELPEPLRATVRTHIGYPTRTASVRAEPAVGDEWMVLGVRTTEEERLHTRRTWLYGRRTRRWALLVDHSFGTAEFPKDVPPLGMMAEANVHYYPAAAPLRALWGERYGGDEPFTTLPGAAGTAWSASYGDGPNTTLPGVPADTSPAAYTDVANPSSDIAASVSRPDDSRELRGTIARALDAQARALAADPWLWAWPVLLTEVVLVVGEAGWQVAERGGVALPMAEGAAPWQLLGISGGHPVTVIGEWSAAGLVPMSVFTDGTVIDLESERAAGAARSTVSAGNEHLTSVALLGTARRAVDTSLLGEPVGAVAARLEADPAMLLLESVALQVAFARGGVLAAHAELPEPAPEDARRRLPEPAAQRLAAMLRERSVFLPEWFDAAAPHDFRAPDALCALLLEQACAHAGLRPLLLRLAGERGRWLAARHPEWRKLEWPNDSEGSADDSSTVWRTGSPAERLAWFARLRHRDPSAARELLARTWQKESGAVKAELLAACSERLSTDDESLLESALDDRRADVRRTASGLLALLPDSAFAQRMTARARSWIRLEPGEPRFVINLPDPLDADARRDGIYDRPAESTYRWNGTPDPTAGRLRQLVAATPLDHWRTVTGPLDRSRTATDPLDPKHPATGPLDREHLATDPLDRLRTATNPLDHNQTATNPRDPKHPATNPLDHGLEVTGPFTAADLPGSETDPAGSGSSPTTSPHEQGSPPQTDSPPSAADPGGPNYGTSAPETVLRIAVEERFRQPMFDGWVDAALAQQDSAWAKALFEAGVPSDVALLRRRELFALLPEEDRVRHLLRLDGAWFSEIEALLPAMGHPWPEPLAQHLMLLLFERSRVAAQRAGMHGSGPAAHRSLLVAAAAHLPVSSAGMAGVLARRCEDPGWQQAFDRLARDLTHRSMMLEELQ